METKENDGLLLLAGGLDGKPNHAKDVARCALDLIHSCREHSLENLSKEISLEIGNNMYYIYIIESQRNSVRDYSKGYMSL